MFHLWNKIIFLLLLAACLAALNGCSTGGAHFDQPNAPVPAVTAAPSASPPLPSGNADPTTNVAQAQARLAAQGYRFELFILSPASTGLQAQIYQDLIKRNIRSTTGPDEGFDTRSENCYPNCVYVPDRAVNLLSVDVWVNVLRHEMRHMVQATNNPNLARDFRDPNGMFTTYGAFMEACADDGIYIAENLYHSAERMPQLRRVLTNQQDTLTLACEGDKSAYEDIVEIYNTQLHSDTAFQTIFPPYN